ncbi:MULTISPECIES: Eco57I restriction-modification methylase domain-containing protein [unclassified Streptomyces]|uniref:Eco57I restriction-modification methylase domain-containing protein n=1 Tax=unclassified Streptomyces TaxID=2593676 RepID=UPI00299FF53C|nr:MULTISPECIES: Eco57I restriction-modification methylase domain-containing protein [unclassified Streptomyces]MDX3766078.1 Eco57I restriction-modification methylase domain-containing protein [Streptomyces sp. AK08-01B]MDX3815749.1 Eco57I restriction-modification methylase domain-containing protein [Streptomyces sp. AK08-01A]
MEYQAALPPVDDFPLPVALQEAVEHGEVFTRRWVVDTILDLVGYKDEINLADMLIVEPACGHGAFISAIVARLSASCRKHDRSLLDAGHAIEAYDLLEPNVEHTRALVARQLLDEGWSAPDVEKVVSLWINQGDFLLQKASVGTADFVVGNPPYIRLEDVPDDRMDAYRSACITMNGRADIYVGFYEKGLLGLKQDGKLAFICADRWMRNQYGRGLRKLVTRDYSMNLVITMHDVDAFEEQVSAYPAITVIGHHAQGEAVVANTTAGFGQAEAQELVEWTTEPADSRIDRADYHAARLPQWFAGEDSWPSGSPARLAMLEDLSERFRLLEDETTGTRVGIGVATGADKVFITTDRGVAEPERMLPLAMVRDTKSGKLHWTGSYLVNPWDSQGKLVDLVAYPKLASYFKEHQEVLRKRHIARKQPERWYKTIDKVAPNLARRQKLLFPDMKLTIHPVLDEGSLYPHHNLYYIVSSVWDMRVLGGLLLSKVAEAFVEAYAVKMRGGTLRFQAQYLRKIRVPDPAEMRQEDREALAKAFDERDEVAATKAALRAYGLGELPD